MMFCDKCKKSFSNDNKFCLYCGSPLIETQEYTVPKQQGNDISMQINPVNEPVALSHLVKDNKTKKGRLAVVGMFLVNLIPLLGLLLSFIWALVKFKKNKIKLAAIISALIVLNIGVTVFGYTAAVNLMKSSLAKATEKQKVSNSVQLSENMPVAGSYGIDAESPGITDIPQLDFNPFGEIMPGDDEMVNSDLLDSIIPGFSSGTFDSGEYHKQENISTPQYDEDGNMLIDTDGDGVPDSTIDLGESFQSGDFPLPDMDDRVDELPGEGEVDEHGNRYVDTDNDGITDTIFCADGVVLPVKGSRIDEDGQRYYDSNEDGNYDILYDIDGTMHADYDENGIYDITIDKDGNVHYENGDDGIFEGEYETEF